MKFRLTLATLACLLPCLLPSGSRAQIAGGSNQPDVVWFAATAAFHPLLTNAHPVATAYCARAGVTGPRARLAVQRFAAGLDQAGLTTNLADFAFFRSGLNLAAGAQLASLRGTGVIHGAAVRLPGGLWLPNHTSLSEVVHPVPATPQGRTLIVWQAQDFTNHLYGSLAELATESREFPSPTQGFLFVDAANLFARSIDGASVDFLRLAPPMNGFNHFEAVALAADNSVLFAFDHGQFVPHPAPHPVTAPLTVLRLGSSLQFPAATNGWAGVIAGWALFNRVLTTNEIAAVDALVPRVGVYVDGDSKTASFGHPLWPNGWSQSTNAWGVVDLVANVAVSGTYVSTANGLAAGNPNSMELRLDRLLQQHPPPRPGDYYLVWGGHNDLGNLREDWGATNAWQAHSNLWRRARAQGLHPVAATLDRGLSTWVWNQPWTDWLNQQIRTHAGLYDALVDIEQQSVARLGPDYYTNTAYYFSDQVHNSAAGHQLIASYFAATLRPRLGFEPDAPGATNPLFLSAKRDAAGGYRTLTALGTVGVNLRLESATNAAALAWTPVATLPAGTDGVACFTNLPAGRPLLLYRLAIP